MGRDPMGHEVMHAGQGVAHGVAARDVEIDPGHVHAAEEQPGPRSDAGRLDPCADGPERNPHGYPVAEQGLWDAGGPVGARDEGRRAAQAIEGQADHDPASFRTAWYSPRRQWTRSV